MIGPLTPKSTVSLMNTAYEVKTSGGFIGFLYLYNQAASVRFVKLYDQASPPDPATDVPLLTIPVPAGGGCVVPITGALAFSLGIYARCTTLIGYTDNTAPSINDVIANFGVA